MKQEGMALGTKVAIGAAVVALGGGALFMSFGTPSATGVAPDASPNSASSVATVGADAGRTGAGVAASAPAPSQAPAVVAMSSLGEVRKRLVQLGNQNGALLSMGFTPKMAKPVSTGPMASTAKSAWMADHCFSTMPTACLASNKNGYVAAFGQCAAQVLSATTEGAWVYDQLALQRIKAIYEQTLPKDANYDANVAAKNRHLACNVDFAVLLGDVLPASRALAYVRERTEEFAGLRASYPTEAATKWGMVGHDFSSVRSFVIEVLPQDKPKDAYARVFRKISEASSDCSAVQHARDPACTGGAKGYRYLAKAAATPKDTAKGAMDLDGKLQATPPPASQGSEARCLIADIAAAQATAASTRLVCSAGGRALPENPLDRASSPRGGIMDRLCGGQNAGNPQSGDGSKTPPPDPPKEVTADEAVKSALNSAARYFFGPMANDNAKKQDPVPSGSTNTPVEGAGPRGGLCSSAADRARWAAMTCSAQISGATPPATGPGAPGDPSGGWTDPADGVGAGAPTCAGLLASSGVSTGCDAMNDDRCGPGSGRSLPFDGGGWLAVAMAHFGYTWARDPSPESPCGGVPCSGGRPGAAGGPVTSAPVPGSPPVMSFGSLRIRQLPTSARTGMPIDAASLGTVEIFLPR